MTDGLAARRRRREAHRDRSRGERPSPRRQRRHPTARGDSIKVFRRPGGDARTLRARRFEGRRLPLVFLVKQRREGWAHVYLPTRPNLSTGWIRGADVELALTSYRVRVQPASHRLTLFKRGKAVMRTKIAKGRAVSPTPTGRYYVTDLIRPPDPKGFYGPYALGLSAHSPVYTSYAGGDGQVGLHGTNRPSALGTDVSHGCLRVSNRVITKLAKRLPIGTPIDITRS
jgi:lipoprotein-anchoring transpeptidase ErfK/SrfK